MDIKDFEFFLREIGHISKHYEEIAKVTGFNFNVFQIFGLETSEVRLHSSFLAEFLNPNGCHGQGRIFLELFFEQCNIKDFKVQSVFVEVEKCIGSINFEYTEGGRIDFSISNSDNQHIFVENKIYALDQENQLLRYHNYNKGAYLLYLTLLGNEPSKKSISGLSSDAYKIISYKDDIIPWLEKCHMRSSGLPLIRETLTQYINLLKKLTNQTILATMNEEIKKLILSHPEYGKLIKVSQQVLDSIVSDRKRVFFEEMKSAFPLTKIPLAGDKYITVVFSEDGDGDWFGYCLKMGDESLNATNQGVRYRKILKKINVNFRSNNNFIGWFCPEPFKNRQKFETLDVETIINMYDEVFRKEFINRLLSQEREVTDAFLAQIMEDSTSKKEE